jgi:hypothetical protein
VRSRRASALLLCAAAGCASQRLPDYAMPQVEVVDAAKLAHSDGVAYHTLTRADFRGAKSPLPNAVEEAHMSAFTCANVVPVNRKVEMDVRQAKPGAPFVARPKAISFVAKMDRACSWWNPQQAAEGQAYVLQHEQIHFAIVELTARDLTRRARAAEASGDSPQAAVAALKRQLDAVFEAAIAAMSERNTRFDLDTSGRRDPQLQQRWFDDVSAELKR